MNTRTKAMLVRFFGCGAGAYSKQMPQHLFRAALKTDVHSAELGLIHDIARHTYPVSTCSSLLAPPSAFLPAPRRTAALERKQQPTTIWRGGNCGYSFGDLGENPGVAARKLSKLS
jgi:hypothetical protein